MTDNQKKYWDKIMNILEKEENNDIRWVSDLCGLVPMSTNRFYELFPIESNEYDTIKSMLDRNRISLNRISIRDLKNQSESGISTSTIYLNKLTQSKEQKEHMQELKEQETTEKPASITINFNSKKKK